MKTLIVWPATGALLLATTSVVRAEAMEQPPEQTSGQWTLMQNANMSAQSDTDMSYGGVPDTRSASGGKSSRICTFRPRCDIFFGR
jgi:hypothetical protein